MTVVDKVRAVEQVFDELDRNILLLQTGSGLHCKFGCGKCCFKPDIEATILEFLPFAFHLHQQNAAFSWLEKMRDADSLCMILDPSTQSQGLCTEYKHRGLICRLFGYSARTNKYGKKELVTCSIIKTEQSEGVEKAEALLQDSASTVPVMNQYYMRLHGIDYELTREFFPINVAIRKAIETVLQYYAYRESEIATD